MARSIGTGRNATGCLAYSSPYGNEWRIVSERSVAGNASPYNGRGCGALTAPSCGSMRRTCKVLAHETGHMFGIQHCVWYRCLMKGSNHIDEADERPLHLCPRDLRKLQWSVGFDVLQRYRRLLASDSGAGFQDEAGWLETRIRYMERLPGAK
jgi:hypothetical protein